MKQSRIMEILTAVIDVVWAGMLWLLCSLPVVTLGPATTALYYVTVKCIRHERDRLTPSFFRCFAREFRQSLLMWLLYLLYIAVMAADAYAIGRMGQATGVLGVLRWLLFLPAVFSFPWMFAFISRFSNTIGGSLKYVWYLTVKNLGRTLLMTLELLVFVLIVALIPQLLPLLPGVFCLVMSFHIEPVFKSMTKDSSDADENAWYNE